MHINYSFFDKCEVVDNKPVLMGNINSGIVLDKFHHLPTFFQAHFAGGVCHLLIFLCLFIYLFIYYLFIFGFTGSSSPHAGFF